MKQSKHKLESSLPLGQLTSRQLLLKQGYSLHSIDNHLKSGALQKVVVGIYMRRESRLTWQGVVASLPRMLDQPVVAGGLTALELQGFAQYLGLSGERTIHLYSPAACPNWLKQLFIRLPDAVVKWHRTSRLWQNGWPERPCVTTHLWRGEVEMQVSSPEQAVLEVLMTLPDEVSFEHAEQLMQGLTQLSPGKLDALLHSCQSVKVKRVFFWLADRSAYPWRGRLDAKEYDLGSGKRVVAKGGRLDKRYQITVPQALYRESSVG